MRIVRVVFIGLLSSVCALTQAANPCNSGVAWQQVQGGIGGTGQHADAGIGGTGHRAQGGMGGTGNLAEAGSGASGLGGTGIVGIVTGFASLCVNGQEVFYDAGTPTEIEGRSVQAERLERGQRVVIEAVAQAGGLNATRIEIVPVITAPLESVQLADQGTGSVRVLGQTLAVPEGVLGRENLQPGRRVSLSGLARADGSLLLLRADPAEEGSLVALNGVPDAQGRIAGVALSGAVLQSGRAWRVQGVWNGQRLQVTHTAAGAGAAFTRVGQDIGIQGYLAAGEHPDSWQIDGRPLTLNAQTHIFGEPRPGALVIVRGTLGARGDILVREIEHGRERDILERGGSRQRPERLPPPGSAHPLPERTAPHANGLVEVPPPLPLRPEHLPRPERPERMEGIERFAPVGRPGRLDLFHPEPPPRPHRPDGR